MQVLGLLRKGACRMCAPRFVRGFCTTWGCHLEGWLWGPQVLDSGSLCHGHPPPTDLCPSCGTDRKHPFCPSIPTDDILLGAGGGESTGWDMERPIGRHGPGHARWTDLQGPLPAN